MFWTLEQETSWDDFCFLLLRILELSLQQQGFCWPNFCCEVEIGLATEAAARAHLKCKLQFLVCQVPLLAQRSRENAAASQSLAITLQDCAFFGICAWSDRLQLVKTPLTSQVYNCEHLSLSQGWKRPRTVADLGSCNGAADKRNKSVLGQ